MTLGDYLKQVRSARNQSQADLAEIMGIEQSYLSKLESDRSQPSSEILQAWLSALELTLDQLIDQFDPSYVQGRLRQIASVDAYLRERTQHQQQKRTGWLLGCALCIALSVPLFYLGYTKLLFNETSYQYISPGILMPDENPNYFENWREIAGNNDIMRKLSPEMAQRSNPHTLLLPEHRGKQFTVPASDAKDQSLQRTYYVSGTVQQPRPINAWLQALGLFLLVGGIIGLVLERRLFR
ncbi:helix-turn-helix domain-containing protein [Pseudidiomarina mangrovi]|uniref:helix-turn-helix domain-containing protein n=1 Tax=Pseudidiomarina mangrovi TaxID=2487133 RepID=UPI000FCCCF7F|nr:helix-turn-helix transcriptional regulator [Pseudidiomarina mangrovi]